MRETRRPIHERRTARAAPASGKSVAAADGPAGTPPAGGAQPSIARLAPPMQRRAALPRGLARRFEARSGVDLGGVAVTYNSPEPARYGAAAYTRGTDIHLAPGQEHNLAHEAWHAVQQAQGRVGARGRVGGALLNDDPKLEAEADRMASFGVAPHAGDEPADLPFAAAQGNYTMQRKIAEPDRMHLPSAVRETVFGKIRRLNDHLEDKRTGKRLLHERFAMLDELDRTINAHLRDHPGNVSDEQRRAMFNVLRETQEEHVHQTDALIRGRHPLWLGDGAARNDPRQTTWQSLLDGSGNIQFADDASKGFRNRMMSGFAKLLQGAHGSGLVDELNAPQQSNDRRITIKQGTESAAVAVDNEKREWKDQSANRPGEGTGSTVTIAPPLARGASLPSLDTYNTSTRGDPIFGPAFISLGHELGHARHFLRGEGASQTWGNEIPAGQDRTRDQERWTRPEEFVNINTEENSLRTEHGLPQRQYHKSKIAALASDRRLSADQRLNVLFDSIPRREQPEVAQWFSYLQRRIVKANFDDSVEVQAIDHALNNYTRQDAMSFVAEQRERDDRQMKIDRRKQANQIKRAKRKAKRLPQTVPAQTMSRSLKMAGLVAGGIGTAALLYQGYQSYFNPDAS